jgi:hypothetical protein
VQIERSPRFAAERFKPPPELWLKLWLFSARISLLSRANALTRAQQAKQVASLAKPGIYSDGGGVYLRVRASGRSWFFIGTFDGKRIELGLGPVIDASLARARERAETIRQMLEPDCEPDRVRFETAAIERDQRHSCPSRQRSLAGGDKFAFA